MRDAFAVLFFVSVGMLLDPSLLMQSPGLLCAMLAVVMIGKPLAAGMITVALGYPLSSACAIAAALAQVGEFSFMLAVLGKELGIVDDAMTNIVVATAIVSITLNPPMYRLSQPFARWLAQHPQWYRWLQPRDLSTTVTNDSTPPSPAFTHQAVVIGYGPVGRTVCRLLKQNAIQPTVIEMNMDTVRELRAAGIPAIYGDASLRQTLIEAGLPDSTSLVLSASGLQASAEIIRMARDLNPEIKILARANYVRELATLGNAGADAVFAGESEVALALTSAILSALGATYEQIDRERERVRAELIGGAPPASWRLPGLAEATP